MVRPGRAPRLAVICSGRGLAPGASGSLQAPPGRPRALGLTRLGYGAGEVGAGSLRGPSGALLAGWGTSVPLGNRGHRPRRGADVSARPAPFDPVLGARVAFGRRPNMVGAKPRPPLPFRLIGGARPPSAARRGHSWRPPALGCSPCQGLGAFPSSEGFWMSLVPFLWRHRYLSLALGFGAFAAFTSLPR